jgi:hypothetical protein
LKASNNAEYEDGIEQEVSNYLTFKHHGDYSDEPLKFWAHHDTMFPTLSQVARLYLGMSASSVPVECLFSTAGLICNTKRSSISPEKLNRIIFLHDNFEYVKDVITNCQSK